jgi:hypothetical protein
LPLPIAEVLAKENEMKGIPKTMAKAAAATPTVKGPVKQAAFQADFAGADITAVKVELNAFKAKLVAAGLMAAS